MTPIFVINAGSSSLKFSIIDSDSENELVSGLAENLGLSDARIEWEIGDVEFDARFDADTKVVDVVRFIINKIIPEVDGLTSPIAAVGHRTVHGGEKFKEPTLMSEDILKELEALSPLAPLHNPANINGIRAAMEAFTDIPHIGVFDTAFHAYMPKNSFLYGLPYKFYREHKIRRYGFHGSSHGFMVEEAAKFLNKPINELNIISAHLGNGASIAAIKNGISVDTSMGMTPLDGLLMGTRSGHLDPSIIFYLQDELGYSIKEVKDILNKESGLYGISGVSSDCRKIIAAAQKGNERAQTALDVFAYWAAKYIGSYFVPLGHVDAIVFTGGIGENSVLIRQMIVEYLKAFDIILDEQLNQKHIRFLGKITTEESRIPAIVIPTNEELMIARYTARAI
ncbi:MAG: acetate/propionate family kinase [Alphaproteobacteria bacterium]